MEPTDERDRRAFETVQQAFGGGVFPSAAVSVRRSGAPPDRAVFGAADTPTVYDLASLTKPLATTLLVLLAWEEGSLDLEDRLDRYLPEARGASGGATIRDLLRHSAGLPPVPALQRRFPDPRDIDRDTAIRALLKIEPEAPPGRSVVYSCTGFLLLGLVLERLSECRLSSLFEEEIAIPLGLTLPGTPEGYAGFRPGEEVRRLAAPTEFCPWRGTRLRGEVHDESSYCLGGDGGNAGLFADLEGTERLFEVYESGGGLLSPGTVEEARKLQTAGLDRRRGLGLQLHDGESFDGPACAEDSYGHTGFTGTSVWRSPRAGTSAVVLTNRVYYGREGTAEGIAAFRRAFHGEL